MAVFYTGGGVGGNAGVGLKSEGRATCERHFSAHPGPLPFGRGERNRRQASGETRFMGMELELSAVIGGHKVDLNTPLCLSRFSCDGVLAEAEPVYAAA